MKLSISHHPRYMKYISTPLHSSSLSAHSTLSILTYKSTNNGDSDEIFSSVCIFVHFSLNFQVYSDDSEST